MSLDDLFVELKAGRGHFGHEGRPGKRGGSLPKSSSGSNLTSRVDEANKKYASELAKTFGVPKSSLSPRNSVDSRPTLPGKDLADKTLGAGYSNNVEAFKARVDFLVKTQDNPALTELRASYNKITKTEGAFKPPSFVGDYLKEKGIIEKEPFTERNRRQEIADANRALKTPLKSWKR